MPLYCQHRIFRNDMSVNVRSLSLSSSRQSLSLRLFCLSSEILNIFISDASNKLVITEEVGLEVENTRIKY